MTTLNSPTKDLSADQTLAKACGIAAKWWSKQLATVPKQDNGELSMAYFAAVFLSNSKPCCSDPDKLAIFENSLASSLQKQFQESSMAKSYGISTGVDYGPDGLLSEALREAGIEITMTSLPMKSKTTVFEDRVEIRNGYGSPSETVYVRDEMLNKGSEKVFSGALPKPDEALSMEGVKVNLKSLPLGIDENIREFASLLADRLNDRHIPEGFYIAALLLLVDLKEGRDGFTKKPITSPLAKKDSRTLSSLEFYIPSLADEVCPPHFAEAVKSCAQKVNER